MSGVLKYVSKLQSKRVLVVGGTSGMGFCIAEAALEHGARVVVSGHSPEKMAHALDRLRKVRTDAADSEENPVVSGTLCDLAQPSTLETNLDKLLRFATADGTRKLDHVAYTAGDAVKIIPVAEATPDDVTRNFTVRVTGPIMLAKILPKYQNQSHTSSLTLTSGVNSTKPTPRWSIAASVGSATEGLARGLANDLKPVRVNVVSPGAVHTELFDSIDKDKLEGVLANMAKATLTGTVGKPEDLAEAYIYCMKDNYVTGTILHSNGGRLLV